MRPLIFLLKGGPIPVEGEGEPVFPCAYAERVRRIDGRLRAENIQVPLAEWSAGAVRLRGRRIADRCFAGLAYRTPVPPWFAREAPPAPGGQPPADLERLLHLTPLRRFCAHPEVRLALAQERLARQFAPLLAVPDLLEREDRLMRTWEIERPEAAAAARAEARALTGALPALPAGLVRLRARLRLAALRRLDTAAVGREIFLPCPAFFGEPYFDFELRPGLAFKAGAVRMAHAWPSPETEARSREWRASPELVEAAESRLFPLIPPGAGAAGSFAATVQEWIELAPLRDFEARSPLPLFPCETIYPDGYLPRGYRRRLQPDTLRSLGGSPLTAVAARLSPYIAEPFQAACEARKDLLAAWSEDLAGLAADHWG